MKKILLLIIFSIVTINCISQIVYTSNKIGNKPIEIVQHKKRYLYFQDDIQLSIKALLEIVNDDQEAVNYIKKAKNQQIAANVLAYSGGFCLGYGLVDILFDPDEVTWILLGVGAGLAAIAFVVEIPVKGNLYTGVKKYNENLGIYYVESVVNLKLGLTSNGIGLVMNF